MIMCTENGIAESDCKLFYKDGRDHVICESSQDLQLAIQVFENNPKQKRYPKITFMIKTSAEEAKDGERVRREPGIKAQTKRLIKAELEKQAEQIASTLLPAAE